MNTFCTQIIDTSGWGKGSKYNKKDVRLKRNPLTPYSEQRQNEYLTIQKKEEKCYFNNFTEQRLYKNKL